MELKEKRVLVTGGAGFIGSHLVDRLIGICSHVIAMDNLQSGTKNNLARAWGKIEFIEGDVRDKGLVDKVVKRVNVIFHIAANASVPNSVENPAYDFETNARGTFNLLEASKNHHIERFIFASTAAVYGNPIYTPIDENHPLNPISPYGASKLAAERTGFAFKETYGIPFLAIRIFNTYGPRQPRYVIYDFIRKIKQNPKRLEVLGDGNQVRDYCYIDDMVDAFMLVAEKGEGVYNAAGGRPITIRELAQLMVSTFSPETEIIYGGKTWKGDIKTLVADISRLRTLGFEPKGDLSKGDGLEDMFRYL